MNRKECLDAAEAAVLKDRQSTYGPPEDSFADTAAMWAVIFGVHVFPYQVALALAALKIVRANKNPSHADSFADLAGYAACGAELGESEGARQAEMKGEISLPGVVTRTTAESQPLTAVRHDDGDVTGFVSVWKPSKAEAAALAAGGTVVVFVAGSGHPPIALGVQTITVEQAPDD